VVSYFGERFDGACLILALLVFAMTFPGSLARGASPRAGDLALDIAAGWLAIVGLLLFLGWASRTLDVFDPRVIFAWALATPAALFAAHRLLPVVWPRVLAAEGMQKTAVIAGANELGRRLAARLRSDPLLGIRFAGYFDDRAPGRLQNVVPRENLGALSRARRPRALDHRGRDLHRAADGLAAEDPEAARGPARHHRVDLLRARHLRVRPDPGAGRLDRRAAGGGGVRVALLRLQRSGEARLRLRPRRADPRRDLAAHGRDRARGEALLLRPGALQAAPLRPGRQAHRGSTSSAP
jgi:hypothetical protein